MFYLKAHPHKNIKTEEIPSPAAVSKIKVFLCNRSVGIFIVKNETSGGFILFNYCLKSITSNVEVSELDLDSGQKRSQPRHSSLRASAGCLDRLFLSLVL